MAVPLKYIGQAAMDSYLQNYRTGSDFFTLYDFTLRAATTITDIYQKYYDQQYAMLRADRQQEVVAFPSEMLLDQVLEVEKVDEEYIAKLQFPFMGFMGDNNTCGVQEIIPIKPATVELERSSISEPWQYKLLPFTGRIFWRAQREAIKFFKKGFCNISIVKVLYVPAIMDVHGTLLDDALIPDGLVDQAIVQTVAKMKGIAQGTVVKELNDGQSNKILENEANLVKE